MASLKHICENSGVGSMASAHASCNMLFEELAEEDPARKPASPCPYCNAALAFHRRRQRAAIGSSGVVNLAGITISNGDKKLVTSVTIPVKRSLLDQRVCIIWPELKVMAHSLSLHDNELADEDLVLYDGAQVVVNNLCRDFCKFSEEDALSYTRVRRVVVNDDVFHSSIDLRAEDIDCARCELARRLKVCDIYQSGEYTMREFISPLLINALMATPSVKLFGSSAVMGTLGYGNVDFVMSYSDFPVCVTEARREAIDKAVFHNMAQLMASREAYCLRNKCIDADIADVPSCGIVSTGENYIFLRYICQAGEWIMIRSKSFKITLDEHRPLSRNQVGTILAKVLGIIEFQIAAIDSSLTMPRRTAQQHMREGCDEGDNIEEVEFEVE